MGVATTNNKELPNPKGVMEVALGFEPRVEALQASALPLGYATIKGAIMWKPSICRQGQGPSGLEYTILGRQ